MTMMLQVSDLSVSVSHREGWFTRRRRLPILDGVSFAVRRGETFGIVGESGCGKSTLAKAILNLVAASSGAVSIGGTSVDGLSKEDWRSLRRRAQYIFQDPLGALDPRMRIIDQIAEVLAIHDMGKPADRQARAQEQLAAVGINKDLAQGYPHQLSGGQRQRAVIARALVLGPELLICDEPLSALDVSIQAQVVNLLMDMQRKLGLTMLFISHDLALVSCVCERVAVMYMGRIVEMGDTESVLLRPEHPYTKALLATVPQMEADRPEVPDALGEPASIFDPPPGCSFHPRCPSAFARCRVEAPALLPSPDGRASACHLVH